VLKEMSPTMGKYPRLSIYGDNGVRRSKYVHVLVANAWIPNPRKFPVVNHIDGNKNNSSVSNLERVTVNGNVRHSIDVLKNKGYSRPVYQLTLDGKIIQKFESIKNASDEIGVNAGAISEVCSGVRRKAGGFLWTYQEDYTFDVKIRKRKACKKVSQYDKDGNHLATYESVIEASAVTGVSRPSISRTCTGYTKFAGGFKWSYDVEATKTDFTADWKTCPNYSMYKCSPDGRIYSKFLKRLMSRPINGVYKTISMVTDDGSRVQLFVHRFVALTYIPNPENLPVVNHKDGDKLNNDVSNLEWTTHSKNALHAVDMGLTHRRAVIRYDKEGNELERFKSLKDAGEKVGVSPNNVKRACYPRETELKDMIKTCCGSLWKFK
jgi:hypothetical protein